MPSFRAPAKSPVSFGVVKQILEFYGLRARARDLDIAASLRIIYPLDATLASSVRAGAISLTDAATSEEQIRFFQRRRTRRSYIKIAQWITANNGQVRINIENVGAIDTPSREFLDLATSVAGWHVTYTSNGDTSTESAVSDDERALLRVLHPARITEKADQVWAAAFEFINVGDAWTGVNIGRQLADVEQSPRVWNLLALGFAMLNETENAEFYYNKWADDGTPLDKVRALYGTSMLYARHHPTGLRSLGKSALLLDQAFAILQGFDSQERASDVVAFEEVFNRNGYALVLFRNGDVRAALELLESGIARLTQTNEKVAIHRSVLIYNLAQCHKQTGDIDRAIETYERLISVDPHMPEYHLEAAKCFARANDLTRAISFCRQALALDDTLSVAWSLLGLYIGDTGDHKGAAEAHERANGLEPSRETARVDAAYNWILSNDLDRAQGLLDGVNEEFCSLSDLERAASLSAEIHLRRGDREAARNTVALALAAMPESEALRDNLRALAAA